ncbi:MAG TPA: hemerythrin domain-containing protein [Polyangiaceae bacterium]|jgi:hypothetical protein|nr:hemerythrin domain-containing protein [Polyangiaceae bacterium]
MPNRIEKAASEVMGAVKAAKATLENLGGVFKQLSREHGEVTALLLIVKMSSDPKVRRDLFPKIREELLAHEKGELAVVYPAFRGHAELVAYAEMHERDAETLERMIGRLGTMAYEDGEWAPMFSELVNHVQQHAKEEEDEFFPLASRILGKPVCEELNARYLAKKNAALHGIN